MSLAQGLQLPLGPGYRLHIRRPPACPCPLPRRPHNFSLTSAKRLSLRAGAAPSKKEGQEQSSSRQSEQPQGEQSDSEPSTSGDGDKQRHPLHKVLEAVPWLGALAARLTAATSSARGTRVLRLAFIVVLFFAVAGARACHMASTRVVPREVLYSTFVSLLESGRIRTTRLEDGTGRLYFDVAPLQQQPAAEAAVAATAAAAAATTKAATTKAAPAASSKHHSSGRSAPAAAASSSAHAAASGAGSTAAAAQQQQQQQPYRMQRQYYLKLADKSDPALVGRILAAGVEFGVMKASFQSALANIFLTAFALWLPLTPLIFLFKRIVDERSSGSRKKKSSTAAENTTVTFADVAGVESAKEELKEVVAVMKQQRQAYSKLKVKMPSGVLLCGPPGTGKTLLARAVAGEAGIPFIAVSASEFVELFVGRGAARIRELFAEARKVAPCVVFIDEVDAVGAKRGMGYNDERDQTLNQLLTELDGFDQRPGVLFLAATNRADILDPALLRPGRISRKVVVPLPDEPGRRDILGVHMRSTPFANDAEKLEATARTAAITAGFSGAELANVVNEAALLAARKAQEFVTMRELIEGVRRTKFGVNGRSRSGPAGSLFQSVDDWLMGVATAPARVAQPGSNDLKVKNTTS